MRAIVVLYVVLSAWLLAMPAGIEAQLRKSGLNSKDVSIYIKETGSNGNIVATHRQSQSRIPASVIKVMTTYASVLKLGFDYRFPTQFYRSGAVRNGVLEGDLVIKGFGDPTLRDDDLGDIVQRIKEQGIRKITGNIVIDRSYFDVGSKDNSGFDKNTYSPYNAMPDGMMFNERISTVCVTPRKNQVSQKTIDGSYKVINRLKPVNQPCSGRYAWPAVKVDKSTNTPVVSFYGPISSRCGTSNICQVITKPYLSFYYALKERLQKSGVSVEGAMRLRTVPQNATMLFTHYSDPLEAIISTTAKKSNNLYARHLMLYLGAQMYGAPARLNKGRNAVVETLKKSGAIEGNIKIDNGSGLSRIARITAKELGDMLDDAHTRYGKRWMQTLSIAGVDGTIKRRFAGSIVRGKAWMKTGTVNGVKNIAGYVQSRSGQLYTVVILVETKNGTWRGAQLQNDIIKWLAGYSGGRLGYKPKPGQKRVQKAVDAPLAATQSNTSSGVAQEASSQRDTRYFVQAGSFEQVPQKEYLLRIERLGLSYKVLQHAGKYKVLVGPYAAQSPARSALAKIRQHVSKQAFILKF